MKTKLTIASLLAGSLVLVTGATGYTGQHLATRLIRMGARVRAIARPSSSVANLGHMPIEWHRGDVGDPKTVERATEGVHYVMHLASSYRDSRASDEQHRRTHVTGTRTLAAAAARQPGFRRFVHVSTVGVHGHVTSPPADETAPFAPGDIYQTTKLEAEQLIARFGRDSGFPFVTIRPTAIYGPGERRLFKLFRMASHRFVPLIGHSAGMYHLIHVDDLVECLVRAAGEPAVLHQAIICGSSEPISLQDIILEAGSCLGVRNRFLRLPAGPVMALARLCDGISRPFHLRPILHPRRVAFFTKDRAFDVTKMRNLLGVFPQVENREGIRRTMQWYLDHGWLKR